MIGTKFGGITINIVHQKHFFHTMMNVRVHMFSIDFSHTVDGKTPAPPNALEV